MAQVVHLELEQRVPIAVTGRLRARVVRRSLLAAVIVLASAAQVVVVVPSAASPAVPQAGEHFADVPMTHAFYDEIQWLYDEGISTGTPDPPRLPVFEPTELVTREALAAFLYRYAGSPAVDETEPFFSDVGPTHPFFEAIQWMGTTGLSTGWPQAGGLPNFVPAQAVSREATAAFLWRYSGQPLPSRTPVFDDVGPTHPHFDAVQWLSATHVSSGYVFSQNIEGIDVILRIEFRPTQGIERQAVAAFLARLDKVEPFSGCDQVVTIDSGDCDALVALFDSSERMLHGYSYGEQRDGWNVSADPCRWRGVTCVDGRVAGLYLFIDAGTLAPEVWNLADLEVLNISGTFGGTISPKIGSLTSLRVFNIGSDLLTGSIPREIGEVGIPGDVFDRAMVSIRSDGLTGRIPAEIADIDQLYTLHIEGDGLTGKIPPELGKATSLVTLDILGESLTGGIPREIGLLQHLFTLEISGRNLTGSLPAEVLSINAGGIRITGTSLSGPIPAPQGWMASGYSLSDNHFSGPVPPVFGTRPVDQSLRLSGNGCLTAAIPELAAFLANRDPNWNDGCAEP